VGRANLSVAVVGAGMGGLTVAASLQRIGIDVQIYEQARKLERIGAGIHVAPNATKVLSRLGVLETIQHLATVERSTTGRVWNTGELTNFHEDGDKTIEEYGTPYLLFHRGTLHEGLTAMVPPDILHLNKKLIGIQPKKHLVELQFADGSQVQAQAVIGADGIHSVVRDTLFHVSRPEYVGKVAYRTVLPRTPIIEEEMPGYTKWWGPDRHFLTYPISADRELAITSAVPDPTWQVESWSAKGDLRKFKAEFEGFHPRVQKVIDSCSEINIWAIYTRDPLATWVAGRVALLGDSCHPTTPWMGQGAAMAMEDAAVLSRCLDEIHGDPDGIEHAFNQYEATRKSRTSIVQSKSKENKWMQFPEDVSWVYGYDAWNVPLADPSSISTPTS
jgi:6-hydroxynicotinate 3-monooxygenase